MKTKLIAVLSAALIAAVAVVACQSQAEKEALGEIAADRVIREATAEIEAVQATANAKIAPAATERARDIAKQLGGDVGMVVDYCIRTHDYDLSAFKLCIIEKLETDDVD